MSKLIASEFGKRLRELRIQSGLSQLQLACLADVTQSCVTYLETGKRDPRLTTAGAFAWALGVPLQAFFETKPITSYWLDGKPPVHVSVLLSQPSR